VSSGFEPWEEDARRLRAALGEELRQLRDGLAAPGGGSLGSRAFARRLRWGASGVSRSESGERLIPAERLDDWLAVTGANLERRQRVRALRDAALGAELRMRRRRDQLLPLNAPARLAPLYGRKAELRAIRTALMPPDHEEQGATVACLHAPPGYGKSRLALEVLFQHHELPEPGARLTWWVDASSPESITSSLLILASHLNATSLDELRAALKRRVNWLLVFDNAATPNEVEPFVPVGCGSVLVTSRRNEWIGAYPTIELEALSRDDATSLLMEQSGRDDTVLTGLAEELWRVPIFLRQAARYLAERTPAELSVVTYLDLLAERRLEVLKLGPIVEHYPVAGVAAYLIAFESKSQAAVELLTLCALMHHAAVPLAWIAERLEGDVQLPEQIITMLRDPITLLTTLQELGDGLVYGGPSTVSLHEVTQDLCLAWRPPTVIEARASSLRALLLRDFTDETVREDSPLARMLATHARRLAGFARPTPPDAERSADLVRLSLATTRLTGVVPSPSEWLQLVESIHDDLPADSISRPRLRLESGQCVVARGNELTRAIGLFEAGIADCRAVQSADPDIPDWCESGIHNAYAECLQKLNRGPADLDYAEAHYTTALELAHLDRHPDRGWFELQQLNNIGTLQFVRGDLDRAAVLFDEVIQRAEHTDGVGRSVPIWLMNRLNVEVRRTQIARNQHQTDEMTTRLASAITIGRQVLRRTRRTLGPRHPQVARVLRTLAVVERERQRLDRSERLLRLAVGLLTDKYGSREVVPVVEIEAVLADLLALTPSRAPEARELAQAVLIVFEHAYPAGSTTLAEARRRVKRLSAQA
jgi:hypothetical protein